MSPYQFYGFKYIFYFYGAGSRLFMSTGKEKDGLGHGLFLNNQVWFQGNLKLSMLKVIDFILVCVLLCTAAYFKLPLLETNLKNQEGQLHHCYDDTSKPGLQVFACQC